MLKEYATILLEEIDSVLILKLNRPEKLNAFNMQMLDDMLDAIDYANKWAFIAFTRSIDSIVITLRDTESRIGKVLKKIHEKYPDFINWYS